MGNTLARLCVVTAVPMSIESFWRPLLRSIESEFDITVACSGADAAWVERLGIRAKAFNFPILRRPEPITDLRGLKLLERMLRKERFDIVHSQTPKAGFLAMTAAARAGIRARVHTFTGQVWSTKHGSIRSILKWFDRRTARAATALLADSHSQAEFLVREAVIESGRIKVLGNGSINGVDTARFCPNQSARAEVRRDLGVSENAIVFLFLGRLHPDKGILELLKAFENVNSRQLETKLWLIGPNELKTSRLFACLPKPTRESIQLIGPTRTPERFMAAADVFCLPSHREGFGNALIEAGACGLPCIASRIYGIVDAVIHDENGLLFSVGNSQELATMMERLANEPTLRRKLGEAGRARAIRYFNPVHLAKELAAFYNILLSS